MLGWVQKEGLSAAAADDSRGRVRETVSEFVLLSLSDGVSLQKTSRRLQSAVLCLAEAVECGTGDTDAVTGAGASTAGASTADTAALLGCCSRVLEQFSAAAAHPSEVDLSIKKVAHIITSYTCTHIFMPH